MKIIKMTTWLVFAVLICGVENNLKAHSVFEESTLEYFEEFPGYANLSLSGLGANTLINYLENNLKTLEESESGWIFGESLACYREVSNLNRSGCSFFIRSNGSVRSGSVGPNTLTPHAVSLLGSVDVLPLKKTMLMIFSEDIAGYIYETLLASVKPFNAPDKFQTLYKRGTQIFCWKSKSPLAASIQYGCSLELLPNGTVAHN